MCCVYPFVKINVMVGINLSIFDTLAEFIAGTNPERVLAFFAPPEIQKRTDELVFKKKEGALTPEEEQELERIFIFEHIVRLAKIRAYSHLSKQA